jgi:ATP-dependent protease HslVU (ClpYQ) peptidase subunit
MSTTKRRKVGADLLLTSLAIVILEKYAGNRPELRNIIKSSVQDVIKQWGDDYTQLLACKQTIEEFTHKLLACTNTEQVYLALNAIKAIGTGNMYIAAEGQELIPADEQ